MSDLVCEIILLAGQFGQLDTDQVNLVKVLDAAQITCQNWSRVLDVGLANSEKIG
jgi:hypothetical protein